MATILDWTTWVSNVIGGSYGPFFKICIEEDPISIIPEIPIPNFLPLSTLDLGFGNLDELLDGLPEPPNLPPIAGSKPLTVLVRIPVPSLIPPGVSDIAQSLTSPEGAIDLLFNALSSLLPEIKGIPRITLPEVELPTLNPDILSLFDIEVGPCPDEPNLKIEIPIPGAGTSLLKDIPEIELEDPLETGQLDLDKKLSDESLYQVLNDYLDAVKEITTPQVTVELKTLEQLGYATYSKELQDLKEF